nr:hypothetical protein [Tanacetum cinerariifolium]
MLQASPPPNAMEYQEPEPTDKVDEMVAGGVIVDRSTHQATLPLNVMQYHEPRPTDKVDATIFVDVQVDRVQSPKNPSLIDNIK